MTPPFSPRDFNPSLPEPAVATILHALAKNPEERFVSATAFAQAFEQGIQGKWDTLVAEAETRNFVVSPTFVLPSSETTPTTPKSHSHRRAIIVLALTFMVIMATAFTYFTFQSRAQSHHSTSSISDTSITKIPALTTNTPSAAANTPTLSSAAFPTATMQQGSTTISHPYQWIPVSSPNGGSSANRLSSISIADAQHAWAVGFFRNTNGNNQTLIEQWNGSTWSVMPSPNPDSAANVLDDIAFVDAQHAWTVGYSGAGSEQTLIVQGSS